MLTVTGIGFVPAGPHNDYDSGVALHMGEAALLHDRPVDPDQVPQRLVLGVVGADDRRAVIATTGDHHDLVRGYILEKYFTETNPA